MLSKFIAALALVCAAVQARADIRFHKVESGRFGITLEHDAVTALQDFPLSIEVVDQEGRAQWIKASYASVETTASGHLALGELVSPNGSLFHIRDAWSKREGLFHVKRRVDVVIAGAGDSGFSSRLSVASAQGKPLTSYDALVPAVWYRDNQDVSSAALATDLEDQDFWFREDRLPLPLMMIRDKDQGWTLSVFHDEADGATFRGEDGLQRIIDARMRFGAIGLSDNRNPALGFTYPGSEGGTHRSLGYAGAAPLGPPESSRDAGLHADLCPDLSCGANRKL